MPRHRCASDDAGSGGGAGRDPEEGRLTRDREPLPTHVRDLPELPREYAARLDAGLDALRLDLDAPARTAIDDHLRLLLAWTGAINLTAIRDPATAATAQVLDSLAAVPLLRRRGVGRVLDLGTGGGYPGIPLAVATPATAVLVESVAKKVRFLETAVAAIGREDRIRVGHGRAEVLATRPEHHHSWPAVVVRAVADLARIVELGLPFLAPGGAVVAWKRGDIADEVALAERRLAEFGGGTIRVEPVALPGLERHVLVLVEPAQPGP